MSLHCVAMACMGLLAVCISSQMQSAQSQLPSIRSSKWGLGPCPKVTPMKDFNITKLYYQQWYLIAHYSIGYLLDRQCMRIRFNDANPGSDICRISVERSSIEFDDDEIRDAPFFLLLSNETDHSTWIDTIHNFPSKTYVLATDYDIYLHIHECNQFPRDNPFVYEQRNFIFSRTAVWKGGCNDIQTELDRYEGFGIDTGPFVLHDQQDCEKLAPEQKDIPVPLSRLLG